MQVNLNLQCRTNRGLLAANQSRPAVNQSMQSVSFGEKESSGFKNGTMAVLLPLSLLSAATLNTACEKDHYGETNGYAYAYSSGSASAHAKDTMIRDTVYVDKWNTVYVDTGSYHVTHDTITKWKDDYRRPIPLDTLAKHITTWDIDSVDTIGKRNIVHYEYTRPWEYNTKVIANMNQLESGYDEKVLVHDIEILDYKGRHQAYGKHVRRCVDSPVTIQDYDGKTSKTKNGYFLEVRLNSGDRKESSIFDTKLQDRYFLQTAGDSVKVFKYDPETENYVENGRLAKGYLGENTILMKDRIGRYSTEDHLTDVKISAIDDEMLKNLYVRARDDEEAKKLATSK